MTEFQRKVEEMNFNIRKRVLEYDDVLNKQREVIYAERRRVLEGEDLGEQARDWTAEVLVEQVDSFGEEDTLPADWDIDGLFREQAVELDRKKREAILHRIQQLIHEKVMYLPIWQLALLQGYGPRVAESGLGLIADFVSDGCSP